MTVVPVPRQILAACRTGGRTRRRPSRTYDSAAGNAADRDPHSRSYGSARLQVAQRLQPDTSNRGNDHALGSAEGPYLMRSMLEHGARRSPPELRKTAQ
jgi:hypothetical protein